MIQIEEFRTWVVDYVKSNVLGLDVMINEVKRRLESGMFSVQNFEIVQIIEAPLKTQVTDV